MEIPKVIKQNVWLQYLIAVIVVLAIIMGFYYWAKRQGIKEEKLRRDATVTSSLKKAQDSIILADKMAQEANTHEKANEELKKISTGNKKIAEDLAAKYEVQHQQERKEIEDKYETDKQIVNSDMSDYDRCLDICKRSNALAATYGPDFAEFACDPTTQCHPIDQ